MSIQDLGSIGELVAAIATVGTLIYLALQLRQNTRALKTGSTWESETLWAHLNFVNARDPKFSILMTKLFDESLDASTLSEEERAQIQWIVRGVLQFQQSHYLLWRDGSLPTDYYDTRRNWVRWFVRLPLVTPIVVSERSNGILHPEFDREVLESYGGTGDA